MGIAQAILRYTILSLYKWMKTSHCQTSLSCLIQDTFPSTFCDTSSFLSTSTTHFWHTSYLPQDPSGFSRRFLSVYKNRLSDHYLPGIPDTSLTLPLQKTGMLLSLCCNNNDTMANINTASVNKICASNGIVISKSLNSDNILLLNPFFFFCIKHLTYH